MGFPQKAVRPPKNAPSTTISPALAIRNVLAAATTQILDKDRELQLALACFLAGGHLLLEDSPGMGKTTLVKVLGQVLGLDTRRIQFTNDLLPGDIVGISIYDEASGQFVFHRGPIFAQLVLGDELNRGTPKTQSACLQALEERHVTVDGQTYDLPSPFFFVGTQNPGDSVGTYPLPESQLDRFLMRIHLGFPSRKAERELLSRKKSELDTSRLGPAITAHDLAALLACADGVHVSELVLEYILDIAQAARQKAHGFSTRTSLSLIRATKAWALVQGRDFATPQDVQAVAVPVMNHRLSPIDGEVATGTSLAEAVLHSVAVR